MFHSENVGIISSACIGNSRQGRLQIEQPGRDSEIRWGAVYTMRDSKSVSPVTIFRDEMPLKAFNYLSNENSVWAERFRQSGRAKSETSETPQWRITLHPTSMPRVTLHITLQSLFHHFFPVCLSPILNENSGFEGQLWPYVGVGSLGTGLQRDCNAMGDAAKASPRVASTTAQNTILCLLIIHIIPSHQIYVAIDNPSLVPSVSCVTSSNYRWKYVREADNVSHPKNLQSNCCRCFSHLY